MVKEKKGTHNTHHSAHSIASGRGKGMVGVGRVHPAIAAKKKYDQGDQAKAVLYEDERVYCATHLGVTRSWNVIGALSPSPPKCSNSEKLSRTAIQRERKESGMRKRESGVKARKGRGEYASRAPQPPPAEILRRAIPAVGTGGRRAHVPVAVGSGCGGGGCGRSCSRGLGVSVGCVSALQERRELTLQIPLPPGPDEHTPTHTQTYAHNDTGTDTNTDTHVGGECFKLPRSACHRFSGRE